MPFCFNLNIKITIHSLYKAGKIKKLENINIDNFLEVLMKIGLSAYSSN